MFVTPKRIFNTRSSNVRFRPSNCLLVFRPSLLQGAPLKQVVHRCSFFSCRAGRTLRLDIRRQRVVVSYFRGVRCRLGRPVRHRDGGLVASDVGAFLSCYAHFCSHRFVAHSGRGQSVLTEFRQLLSRCFRSKTTGQVNLPAMRCYTSGLYLSPGCFDSLLGGRANSATLRFVRSGSVRVTGARLTSASSAIGRVTCGLNFRCPRRFAQLFGGRMNCAPGRCETRIS